MNEPIPGPGIATARQPYYALYGITQSFFDKCNCESSNYNALQVQVVKRFSNNLSLQANYSYQRAFDYGEFGTPTDQYDTKMDYGPASYNRTHVFTLGHSYFLPLGESQRWLSNPNRVYNAFNYTNLANPSNTNTDTPTAGIITDVQSPMRNMQFGFHLRW